MSARLYIGNRNYSSWSLRAALVVNQSGLPCTTEVIPLDLADTDRRLQAAGPSGLVPVLHHEGRVIWDSLAIAEYLAEQCPDAGLWPTDVTARARARSVSAEMHSGFQTLRARLPMDMRGRHPRPDSGTALDRDIARIQTIWRECRQSFGAGGDFLFGAWCIADAMFAPVVSRFRSYQVALDGPVRDYCNAVWAWPAMAQWLREAEAESWTIDLATHQ